MPDLSNISHYPLKMIFAIHLVLVTWGIQGHWCPKSAMVYNLLFFICLLWAVHNIESDEPLQFALFINVLSIFFDIVTLSVYFPVGLAYASEKFSAAFMIINLIMRAVTSIYLLRIGQARGGSLATMFTPCPVTGQSVEQPQQLIATRSFTFNTLLTRIIRNVDALRSNTKK